MFLGGGPEGTPPVCHSCLFSGNRPPPGSYLALPCSTLLIQGRIESGTPFFCVLEEQSTVKLHPSDPQRNDVLFPQCSGVTFPPTIRGVECHENKGLPSALPRFTVEWWGIRRWVCNTLPQAQCPGHLPPFPHPPQVCHWYYFQL